MGPGHGQERHDGMSRSLYRPPRAWEDYDIDNFGIRHWQTLIRIVTLHPDCLGRITENRPAGCIHWPTVAKYFPWGDKEYWALGPAGHDVIYRGPTRP